MKRVLSISLVLVAVFVGVSSALATALDNYVAKPDSAYRYELVRTVASDDGAGYIIDMVSQTWRSPDEVDRTEWRHWLHIAVPRLVRHDKALLYIDGDRNGKPAAENIDGFVASMAVQTESVVARIKMIPNEPLRFNGEDHDRWEDSIIAYSWDKYMTTGDDMWPLQLPMVKSAVRAMDTVQDFIARESDDIKIKGFVVAGASKRGWTTWLTAAVDKRVVAIAPIVIDMLNSEESFRHHRAVYGFYAPAVRDYEQMGIFERLGTPESNRLMEIVDPYSYRDRLTMPKFLINSASDQFFCPDSWRFYYQGLHGPKYLRYVPNCGHGLEDSDALESLTTFYQAILEGWEIPRFNFSAPRANTITIQPIDKPSAVVLWQAVNPKARDFRIDVLGREWNSSTLQAQSDGSYIAKVSKPDKGFKAFFVELTFDSPGRHPFKMTTGTKVVPDIEPFASQYRTKTAAGNARQKTSRRSLRN